MPSPSSPSSGGLLKRERSLGYAWLPAQAVSVAAECGDEAEARGLVGRRVYGLWAKYRMQVTGRPDLDVILQQRKTCR